MSLRAKRIRRNLVSMTTSTMVGRAIALITTVYLARTLMPENYGIIVFATTVISYMELLVNAGFTILGPREIARDPSHLSQLTSAILTMRLLLAGAAFVLLAGVIVIWPSPSPAKFITLIYGISLFSTAADLGWVFQGVESMHFIAIAEIVVQSFMAISVVLLVRSPNNLAWVPVFYLAGEVLNAVILARFYTRRFGPLHLTFKWQDLRPLAIAALPLALSGVMGAINFNFDTLMVGIKLGALGAGFYGAAYRIAWLPSLIAVAYFVSLSPSLSRAYHEGLASVDKLLDKSVRVTSSIALGLGVGSTILARPVVLFLFGPSYHESVLVFQILIWTISLMFISRNYRYLLIAFNQQRAELKVITSAAVVNIIGNLVLIPHLGLPGAAMATVASEAVILVLGYLYTKSLIGHVPLGRHLPRIVIAALLMGAILYFTEPINLFIRIALGAGIYGVAILALQVVTIEELELLLGGWRPIKATATVETPIETLIEPARVEN